MSEKVLVTGARGFVGAAVVGLLTRHGFRVCAASRDPAAAVPGAESNVTWPADLGAGESLLRALDGITHVVHCAGNAQGDVAGEAALTAANAMPTGELAAAAAQTIPGKLVFLSSARAVRGSQAVEAIDDETEPQPDDDYGRSKLEAERRLQAAYGASRRWTILRPVMVYGPGARGQIGALMRLAGVPMPLPFASLRARRSLLDRDGCAEAVLHALLRPETDGRTFLVSDGQPLSVAEMLTAFRRGLGRPPGLFPVPPALLASASALVGQRETWRRLSGGVAVDPSGFAAASGWTPPADTAARLQRLAALVSGPRLG